MRAAARKAAEKFAQMAKKMLKEAEVYKERKQRMREEMR